MQGLETEVSELYHQLDEQRFYYEHVRGHEREEEDDRSTSYRPPGKSGEAATDPGFAAGTSISGPRGAFHGDFEDADPFLDVRVPATPARPARTTPSVPVSRRESAAWSGRAASPGTERLDKLTEVVTGLAHTVAGLASVASHERDARSDASTRHTELLQKLADTAAENRKALRPDKPRLTAAGAAALYYELRQFRLYMNDSRLYDRVHWFTGARNVATGKARVTLESFIVRTFGNEERYQAAVDRRDPVLWDNLWKNFETAPKVNAGLDDASELNEAARIYNQVTLAKGASVEEVDTFVTEYQSARTRMVENGLICDGNESAKIREIEDLKNKLEGTVLLEWLLQLPEFPTEVDSKDPKVQRTTFLGRVRQWIASKRRP